jgi:hypothetical protein
LRVLTPEGQVPTVGALITRNIFRIVDSMPLFYVVGLLFVFFGKRHLRLGDLAPEPCSRSSALRSSRSWRARKIHGSRQRVRDARQHAATLSRRRGSDVSDALVAVENYRLAAHSVSDARLSTDPPRAPSEYLEAVYSDLHDTIHRPARRIGLVLLSLMRDRVPAAMYAMRVHLLSVVLLFIVSAVTGAWLVYSYPDLIALFAARSSSPPSSAASCGPMACSTSRRRPCSRFPS